MLWEYVSLTMFQRENGCDFAGPQAKDGIVKMFVAYAEEFSIILNIRLQYIHLQTQ